MKKKLFAMLLFCFCIILCGCSSAPEYTMFMTKDGTVVEIVDVPFSASELRQLGVTDEGVIVTLLNRIVSIIDAELRELSNSFTKRLSKDVESGDLTHEDSIYFLNAIKIEKELEMEQIRYVITYDSVLANLYYKSTYQYKDLLESLKKDDYEYEKTLFYYNKISKGKSLFGSAYNESMTLAQAISNATKTMLTDLQTNGKIQSTTEQINQIVPNSYIYRFGMPTPRLHSNADRVFTQSGVTFHEWDIMLDNSSQEVVTWTTHINKNIWYATILAAGIALGLTLFVCVMFKDKKLKQQTIKPTN